MWLIENITQHKKRQFVQAQSDVSNTKQQIIQVLFISEIDGVYPIFTINMRVIEWGRNNIIYP